MRFHLDEHVDHAVATGLRSRGIDVTTATDADLLGATDEAHLAFARIESRVIFTNDADFLQLADQGEAHAGIAYCAPAARTIGEIVRHLVLMHDCLADDEVAGRIEFL
jgi:hypothetical protein